MRPTDEEAWLQAGLYSNVDEEDDDEKETNK